MVVLLMKLMVRLKEEAILKNLLKKNKNTSTLYLEELV